ncbi:unnamed protein product [Heterotrigona itama]|uniref:Uncharacterized protein n=1 Tax=Heterotrigona itama TaxID=395501 RepID=A0A6V7GWB5_9HYME|nr:unnamed protein product [Heterotrigona itama]
MVTTSQSLTVRGQPTHTGKFVIFVRLELVFVFLGVHCRESTADEANILMMCVRDDAILENNGAKIKYVVQLEGAELSECEHESERRKEYV